MCLLSDSRALHNLSLNRRDSECHFSRAASPRVCGCVLVHECGSFSCPRMYMTAFVDMPCSHACILGCRSILTVRAASTHSMSSAIRQRTAAAVREAGFESECRDGGGEAYVRVCVCVFFDPLS